MYVPNNRASKCMKQNQRELKEETDNNSWRFQGITFDEGQN